MSNANLLTPEGIPAGNMDRVMLLAQWAAALGQTEAVISAAMGKPTYPIHPAIIETELNYWQKIAQNVKTIKDVNTSKQIHDARDAIAKSEIAIGYGHPQGDMESRKILAKALSNRYGVTIEPENLLFTVGDVAALHNIFHVLNKRNPNGRIVTPFPYYGMYAGGEKQNRLHPIHVMKQSGYRLTAEALEASIKEANKTAAIDGGRISAFLFCDPNNPLGTVVGKEEWAKIADILRKPENKNIPIILDEAYSLMQLEGKHVSLLEVAPDLAPRIILCRTATKDLSAAGLSQAALFCQNKELMGELVSENIAINGHAPRPEQMSFAVAMKQIEIDNDNIECVNAVSFYKAQVNLVQQRLNNMGANMPDPQYKTRATFYVLANLRDLIGLPLPEEAKRALGKEKTTIETDEDISYYLLFKHRIAIAPLSYYGLDPKLGYMRITCSVGDTAQTNVADHIENELKRAREIKYNQLFVKCRNIYTQLKATTPDSEFAENFYSAFNSLKQRYTELQQRIGGLPSTAKKLSEANFTLQKFIDDTKAVMGRAKQVSQDYAATKIKATYRGYKARENKKTLETYNSLKWKRWVQENFPLEMQPSFMRLPPERRNTIKPWTDKNMNEKRKFFSTTQTPSHLPTRTGYDCRNESLGISLPPFPRARPIS